MKRYRRTGNAIWRLCIHVSSGANFCSSLLTRAALANPDYRLPDVAIVPLFIAIHLFAGTIAIPFSVALTQRETLRYLATQIPCDRGSPIEETRFECMKWLVLCEFFGVCVFFFCSIACVAFVEFRWLEFVMRTHVEIHRIVAKIIIWEFCLDMCVQTQLLNSN